MQPVINQSIIYLTTQAVSGIEYWPKYNSSGSAYHYTGDVHKLGSNL